MKNTFFTLLTVILATVAVFAQQVPRDKVVIEEATGTW